MPINDAQDLPEDSAKEEIIRALLRSAPTAHHSPIDIDLLVRVACGIGSPTEEMDLIREASRSAEVRHRFTAVRRRALTLAKVPAQSVAAVTEEDQKIVAALQLRLSACLQAAGAPSDGPATPSWEDLCHRAGAHANALRILVRATGASLLRSRAHLAYAEFRDQADGTATVRLATGVSGTIAVLPADDGALDVSISIVAESPDAFDAVKGRLLFLSLADPGGGSVPLHTAPIHDSLWTARLDSFGQATGLDSSGVSPLDFHVRLDSEPRLATPRRYLYVEVASDLQTDGVSMFPAELAASPLIREGVMVLEIRLPEDIPRLFHDAALEIAIGFQSSAQVIGTIDLDRWPEGFRRVEIALIGVADGLIEAGSIVQLRLTPSV